MRAAVFQLFHEASAVSPLRVGRADFLARHHMRGEAVRETFGGTKNWMGGVLSALEEAEVETEIGLCTAALPGGPVDAGSFAALEAELLESLDEIVAHGTIDHVFLLLHGALLVEGRRDPEGDLALALRRRLGQDAHLAVPLDFHANPSPGLMKAADLVIGGKLYPHTDTRDRGRRLVELALSCPELRTRHVAMDCAVPMPRQETTTGPFAELAALTNQLEGGPIADVTLLGGFPFSDAPFAGTSALITARSGSEAVADELRAALDVRLQGLTAPVPGLEEAISETATGLPNGRILLVDVGDNPGGGGLGDQTGLLPHLLALDCSFAFGALVAPELVSRARQAAVGGSVEIFTERGALTAKVEALPYVRYRNRGPMMTGEELDGGEGAVLALGRGLVLATTNRIQAYDPEAFRSCGLEPEAQQVLAIKSIGHFRAGYAPLATGGIVLTDSGGWSSPQRGIPSRRNPKPNI